MNKNIKEDVLKEVTQKAIQIALDDGLEISKDDLNDKNFNELQSFTIDLTLQKQQEKILQKIEDLKRKCNPAYNTALEDLKKEIEK